MSTPISKFDLDGKLQAITGNDISQTNKSTKYLHPHVISVIIMTVVKRHGTTRSFKIRFQVVRPGMGSMHLGNGSDSKHSTVRI